MRDAGNDNIPLMSLLEALRGSSPITDPFNETGVIKLPSFWSPGDFGMLPSLAQILQNRQYQMPQNLPQLPAVS